MAGDPHAGPSNLRRLQADGAAQPASGPPEAQRFEQWSAGARITELEERDGEGNERREERLPVQGPPSGDHQAGLLSQQRFRVEAAARPISSLLEGIRNEQWWAGARGMGSEGRDEDREKRGGEMLPLAGCKELEGAKIAGKEMREGDVAEWGASTSGVHLRGEEGAWEMGDAKVGPFGPQHSSREETREGFVAVWGGNAASSTADERYVEGVRLLEGMNINFLERPLNKRRDERRDGAGMGGNLDSDSAGARRVEGDGELEDSKAGLLEQLHRGYDSVGEEEQEEANLVQLDLNHTPMWEALGVASGAATMGELRRTHAVRRPPEGLHSDDEQGQEEQQMLAQRQQQPCTEQQVEQQAERQPDGQGQLPVGVAQPRIEVRRGWEAHGATALLMKAVAPGEKVGVSGGGGGGGGRFQQLLPRNISMIQCSSSGQSSSLAGSNVHQNPSHSAGGSSSHPVRKRKRQKGCDEGGEMRETGKVLEGAEKKEKEKSASKNRRRIKDNSRDSSGKNITDNLPGKKKEEAFRCLVNNEVAARLAMKEGEGGVMGESGGAEGGRDHPGVKSGGEEGGSCGTGWTEERGVRQAGGFERGKEEPGVVSGGSADSAGIGALQKSRRKPGPDRKSGPVTKACVDSRVRECNVFCSSALFDQRLFYAYDSVRCTEDLTEGFNSKHELSM